jgi:histidinol dehydrogenase
VHVISADEKALKAVAPHVEAMARAEGLVAHANSVLLRSRRPGP